MEEKVRGEKGIKYIKIEKKTEENGNCETGDRDKDEMYKMIIKILEEYEAPKKDKDEEYIKSKEGCYEKYIRAYFPGVLEEKDFIAKNWGEKKTVIFMNSEKIYAIKNITVYHTENGKVVKIKNYIFNVNEPYKVEEKIKYKETEMSKKDLYSARIKTGAIMCDIAQMA